MAIVGCEAKTKLQKKHFLSVISGATFTKSHASSQVSATNVKKANNYHKKRFIHYHVSYDAVFLHLKCLLC